MKTTQIILLSVISLASAVLAVDPPPDGGYANQNTAEGEDALFSLMTGIQNTAIGFNALYHNTTGSLNTATGYQALFNNTKFGGNTADGSHALFSNTTGTSNTATGTQALYSNTTGYGNSADGNGALFSNTTGYSNTAIGVSSLGSNTTGSNNAGIGLDALFSNTTGNSNTATGSVALYLNTTGRNNTAMGYEALQSNTTGSNNIAIGALAGFYLTAGSNNIDFGAYGAPGESNTMRLGRYGVQKTTFIAGVSGATVPGGVAVVIDNLGHLGTLTSSARYKEAIKPMDNSSEAILSLKPVTFRYKKAVDPQGIPQFGLVAEQVEKVDPDLVAYDEEGKPYTVRYEAVNAMLLNEFLKAHATISELKLLVAKQQEQVAELASQIQIVSNRLEASGRARRIVVSDP